VISSYVESFCTSCGETVQVHRDTGRCQRCGKPAAGALDPRVPPANGHDASLRPATSTAQALPDTAASRKWLAATQTYVEELVKQAVSAHELATTAAKESAAIDATLSALRLMLGRFTLPTTQVIRPVTLGRTSRKGDRWAMHYDACINCGRTDRRHASKGRCITCQSYKSARMA
jgi:hypothetical protein